MFCDFVHEVDGLVEGTMQMLVEHTQGALHPHLVECMRCPPAVSQNVRRALIPENTALSPHGETPAAGMCSAADMITWYTSMTSY